MVGKCMQEGREFRRKYKGRKEGRKEERKGLESEFMVELHRIT